METKGCGFNIGVECTDRSHCSKCGWNPKVEKVRKEKLREKKAKVKNGKILYHLERIKKATGLDPRKFYDLVELLKMIE